MCLATPVKLIKINGNKGYVDRNGSEYEVNLDLIDNPQGGDWLLCHADLAINKIPENEARKILEVVTSCPHQY